MITVKYKPFIFLFAVFMLILPGCGSGSSSGPSNEPPVYSPLQVLVPEAPQKKVIGNPPVSLDISNQNQGYMTVSAQEDASRINIQLLAPDGINYSYFIDPGEHAVIPFSGGTGTYQLLCYQQVGGSQYAALYTDSLEVDLDNEFLPFLYPNQYVNYTPDSEAVKLAYSLLDEDASDIDSLDAIYTYVTGHIVYDTEKAASVESGYLPDIDETLHTEKGICFDYAALMTAMLRSRDIPCKLQIGYSADIKHAWIDVYIRSKGWVDKAIVFDGETWGRMDPTFDSTSDDKDSIRTYIGDGTNYTLQYTR